MKKSMLCLSLTEDNLEKNTMLAEKYSSLVDMVELRADFLRKADLERLDKFIVPGGMKSILTIRRKTDGGKYIGSEESRIRYLRNALKGNYQFVDLERDIEKRKDAIEVKKLAEKRNVTIIRSMHMYEKYPSDIEAVVRKIALDSTEIPKLAIYPRSNAEQLELLKAFERLRGFRKILIGMGDYGIPFRILSSKLDNFISFTSVKENNAAPGHIPVDDTVNLYGYHGINDETEIFGVIGNPVMHTKSPLIHNSGFRELKLNAVYIPFLVDDPEVFFEVANLLGVVGISVTVPYKERIIPLLMHKDTSVEQIGACNTVYRCDGSWCGTNADWQGFLEPLERSLGKRLPAGTRVTVIGAGGAARAVIYALKERGAQILVLNRSVERARRIAEFFGCNYEALSDKGIALIRDYSEIIVQATTLGMSPNDGKNPIEGYRFTGKEIAYDLVYKPEKTLFLERAEKAGCTIIKGKEMLLAQAKIQFKIFTKRDFPFFRFWL